MEDKKPEIVAVETQIAHSEKRVSDLSRVMERVQKDEDRQADSLRELEQGAADIARRKDEAAGKSLFWAYCSDADCSRSTEEEEPGGGEEPVPG